MIMVDFLLLFFVYCVLCDVPSRAVVDFLSLVLLVCSFVLVVGF